MGFKGEPLPIQDERERKTEGLGGRQHPIFPSKETLESQKLKIAIPNYSKESYNFAERTPITSEHIRRWLAPANIPGFESSPGTKTWNMLSASSVEKSSIPKSFATWKLKTQPIGNQHRMMPDEGRFAGRVTRRSLDRAIAGRRIRRSARCGPGVVQSGSDCKDYRGIESKEAQNRNPVPRSDLV